MVGMILDRALLRPAVRTAKGCCFQLDDGYTCVADEYGLVVGARLSISDRCESAEGPGARGLQHLVQGCLHWVVQVQVQVGGRMGPWMWFRGG